MALISETGGSDNSRIPCGSLCLNVDPKLFGAILLVSIPKKMECRKTQQKHFGLRGTNSMYVLLATSASNYPRFELQLPLQQQLKMGCPYPFRRMA